MNKKEKLLIAGTAAIVLLGILLMAYPLFSAWYSEITQAEVHTQYQEELEQVDMTHINNALAAAREYNDQLTQSQFDPLDPVSSGYFEQLDLNGSGIMGYISIPKINVHLPIFHGVGDDVLTKGAGHMSQSSLPVGGDSTHCVISAHSGMASNPMFSNLEMMELNDIFQIEVLNEILTYQVDNIEVVLPVQIDTIQIQPGKDLCTLITCTPFGINTHRLLVRGHRIPTPEVVETVPDETAEAPMEDDGSAWMNHYVQAILIGFSIAVGIITIAVIIFFIVRKRNGGKYAK